MPKGMAKEKRPPAVDTEDRVMERVVEAATWLEHHRRTALIGALAFVGLLVAGYYYLDYRSKLMERASIRLQEIRFSSNTADLETVRSDLRLYLEQYGKTPYAGEARILLAGMELRRDSLGSAIRILEPAADLTTGSPTAYAAAEMIAAAFEQGGQGEQSVLWWERIAAEARFEYQKHRAMAQQARLHMAAGRYDEAAALYETLADEAEQDDAELHRVRLGEVKALRASGAAPPAAVPSTLELPAEPSGTDQPAPETDATAEPDSGP
jgi:predicted negative regulator of RcsB-dependent stress response